MTDETTLRPGDPVIICDYDKPAAELVAVLVRLTEDGIWHARYLSDYPNLKKCHSPEPTALADFGQRLVWEEDGFYRCETVGPSRATYRDGKPRCWQDHTPDTLHRPRRKALEHLAPEHRQNPLPEPCPAI